MCFTLCRTYHSLLLWSCTLWPQHSNYAIWYEFGLAGLVFGIVCWARPAFKWSIYWCPWVHSRDYIKPTNGYFAQKWTSESRLSVCMTNMSCIVFGLSFITASTISFDYATAIFGFNGEIWLKARFTGFAKLDFCKLRDSFAETDRKWVSVLTYLSCPKSCSLQCCHAICAIQLHKCKHRNCTCFLQSTGLLVRIILLQWYSKIGWSSVDMLQERTRMIGWIKIGGCKT